MHIPPREGVQRARITDQCTSQSEALARSRPAGKRSSAVFPQPDRPMMAMNSMMPPIARPLRVRPVETNVLSSSDPSQIACQAATATALGAGSSRDGG